jgi:hypothetical protein
MAFLRDFEKKNKDIKKITETIVRGAQGVQSLNIPDKIFQNERNALIS